MNNQNKISNKKKSIISLTKSLAYVINDGGKILLGTVVDRSSQSIVKRLTSIKLRCSIYRR